MPFYIRKSLRFGPLRLNLSKSGSASPQESKACVWGQVRVAITSMQERAVFTIGRQSVDRSGARAVRCGDEAADSRRSSATAP
jgi:hypothetical protein